MSKNRLRNVWNAYADYTERTKERWRGYFVQPELMLHEVPSSFPRASRAGLSLLPKEKRLSFIPRKKFPHLFRRLDVVIAGAEHGGPEVVAGERGRLVPAAFGQVE